MHGKRYWGRLTAMVGLAVAVAAGLGGGSAAASGMHHGFRQVNSSRTSQARRRSPTPTW
jgi:hypothetical protein